LAFAVLVCRPLRCGDLGVHFALANRVSISEDVVMMIEPKQSDIGREVIYRASNAEAEEGVITRFNEKYVFVRFGKEEKSVVTTRDQLEWRDAPL
jgi:hypothetical protein